ncbi:MAG: thiamine-phosphate kinase [Polyangiaceae bacterium]
MSRQPASTKRSSEFARIERIGKILGVPDATSVPVGIGDDAAVVRIGKLRLVWTTDSHVEGVHFSRALMSFQDVGFRSFNAAVSDIGAMGASAIGALSAIALPNALSDKSLYQIVEGQAAAARDLGCPVIGGNLARAREVSVTTTVLGHVKKPLLRDGAQVGDEIWLIGAVGLSAAGLAWLSKGSRTRPGTALRRAAERCVHAFRRPRALLNEGRALSGRATSAIDISDGLVADASHLAERSGVRMALSASAVLDQDGEDLMKVAVALGRSALDFALFGGEDYALLATGHRRNRPNSARVIGCVEAGDGVVVVDQSGRRKPVRGGFEHFNSRA